MRCSGWRLLRPLLSNRETVDDADGGVDRKRKAGTDSIGIGIVGCSFAAVAAGVVAVVVDSIVVELMVDLIGYCLIVDLVVGCSFAVVVVVGSVVVVAGSAGLIRAAVDVGIRLVDARRRLLDRGGDDGEDFDLGVSQP